MLYVPNLPIALSEISLKHSENWLLNNWNLMICLKPNSCTWRNRVRKVFLDSNRECPRSPLQPAIKISEGGLEHEKYRSLLKIISKIAIYSIACLETSRSHSARRAHHIRRTCQSRQTTQAKNLLTTLFVKMFFFVVILGSDGLAVKADRQPCFFLFLDLHLPAKTGASNTEVLPRHFCHWEGEGRVILGPWTLPP